MEISFRRLLNGDEESYRSIRLECLKKFPDNFGSSFEEENSLPELSFEGYIAEENEHHFMIGALVDEKLIGICGFKREMRSKTMHRGEIVQMYVDPEFSGMQIGERLLGYTITKAFENVGISQMILSVVSDNIGANKLYEKLGFREYGRLERYFIQGDRNWTQRFMVLEK